MEKEEIERLIKEVCSAFFGRCSEFHIATDNCTCSEDAAKVKGALASIRSEGFIYPTMMVAHGEGYASTLHRFGEPCALCRPPIEITDEMVERARKASFDGFARSALIVPLLRAALEAALNG
jgi:hypothetical protein